MGYQPMVGDMAGEIILRANEVAARNKLAQQGMGLQRQQQVMQSMGDLGQAVADWQKQTALKKQNLAELEAWGGSGLIPDDVLNKLSGERDENKVAGQLAVLRYMGEMEGRKRLAMASDGSDAAASWEPSIVDLGGGIQAFMSSPKSAIMLPQGGTGGTSQFRVVQGDGGYYLVDLATGVGQPVLQPDGSPVVPRSAGGTQNNDNVRRLELLNLDQKIGDLHAELTKARASKLWPWDRKPDDILKEIEALEIKRQSIDR